MKKKILLTVITALLFLCSSNLLVSANPVPVLKHGYSPLNIGYNGSIEFFSEEVTYTIDKSDDANVDAYYVFNNTKNETTTQEILLPFDSIPSNLEIRKNGKRISYQEIDYDLNLNFTHVYEAVSFNLTFQKYEQVTINIQYDLSNAVSKEKKSGYTKYSCTYLSETGKGWNNSLKYANFSFKIKKSLYNGGISGFYVEEKGDYVIASKNLTDWIPKENVNISWRELDTESIDDEMLLICCGGGIAVIVILIIVVALIFFRMKEDKRVDNKKSYQKSCIFCNRSIPFDSKVCPYCGKKI